jgi:hypothetical protein
MSEKTLDLYNAVLQKLLQILEESYPGEGIAARLVISDFEEAILKSMQATFPRARVRGCWFHYGQVQY